MTYAHLTNAPQRRHTAQLFRLIRRAIRERQAQSRHTTRLALKTWYHQQAARHRHQLEGAREMLRILHG